jgi:hypothetical protein
MVVVVMRVIHQILLRPMRQSTGLSTFQQLEGQGQNDEAMAPFAGHSSSCLQAPTSIASALGTLTCKATRSYT